MRWIKQTGFGSVSMHSTDRDFLLDQRTTACFLARSWTRQAQDVGERQHFFDQACSLSHRTLGDQFEIAGDVDMRRAIYLAWWLAVGIVVRENHLKVGTSNME